MNDRLFWYVGVDWGSAVHQVCVIDTEGAELGNRGFRHSGSGLAAMADWITELTAADPEAVGVAIEVPHGPVVESLQGRGFEVHAINPKQLDRYRDRFFPSGAKDDRRDARVLADALRTDPQALRKVSRPDPLLLDLREHSRISEELTGERTRLGHRMRAQLWRYYPQLLELGENVTDSWVLDIWTAAPTPAAARQLRKARVARLLKRNRIRRIDADGVLQILRQPAIQVAPGTTPAAVAGLTLIVERLRLVQRQLADTRGRIDDIAGELAEGGVDEPGGRRDAAILMSLPGVGRKVLAALLSEAHDPLLRRDYHALRALCGVAPVTKRSGKGLTVTRRRAMHNRLNQALYHWARSAITCDPVSRAKYDALRKRGHRHARALRSVGDRLLAVACAMLRNQTYYLSNSSRIDPGAA